MNNTFVVIGLESFVLNIHSWVFLTLLYRTLVWFKKPQMWLKKIQTQKINNFSRYLMLSVHLVI